jgi:hypothetical protein
MPPEENPVIYYVYVRSGSVFVNGKFVGERERAPLGEDSKIGITPGSECKVVTPLGPAAQAGWPSEPVAADSDYHLFLQCSFPPSAQLLRLCGEETGDETYTLVFNYLGTIKIYPYLGPD